ncbi:carbohydrate ABC transporter permease [Clostridium tunisiense]|uniref:carbohydrate ABC transporter permease n=1 Tax=Clostridium tunisiense TaxID=219748 RepID=UPI00030C4427|nr:sugar ABC transporter permease [Clostridium tunisiense]
MRNKKAFLYLLPSLIIIILFQIYPVFKVLAMSFYTKFDYIKDIVYKRGLDNYAYVLKDPEFYLALKNTFLYVIISVPLSIGIALIFALILNSNIKFKKFFRTIYFIPFVTSTVAISVVWKWIFSRDMGLANILIGLIGISPQAYLSNSSLTLPLLILLNVWKGLGYKIIIILAGLQTIDDKYYNAAMIDGANKFQRFKSITVPLLSPIIYFLAITSVIGGFKIFDEVFVLYDQKPGPLQSGLTIVYYVFNKFYMNWQFAIASSAAFVLFIIILTFTLIQLFASKKKVHY